MNVKHWIRLVMQRSRHSTLRKRYERVIDEIEILEAGQ
jgi:hypothetical protein